VALVFLMFTFWDERLLAEVLSYFCGDYITTYFGMLHLMHYYYTTRLFLDISLTAVHAAVTNVRDIVSILTSAVCLSRGRLDF